MTNAMSWTVFWVILMASLAGFNLRGILLSNQSKGTRALGVSALLLSILSCSIHTVILVHELSTN